MIQSLNQKEIVEEEEIEQKLPHILEIKLEEKPIVISPASITEVDPLRWNSSQGSQELKTFNAFNNIGM